MDEGQFVATMVIRLFYHLMYDLNAQTLPAFRQPVLNLQVEFLLMP
jgi:hypothetical protein